MTNETNIRRFSAAELREMRARSEGRSDLARVDAMSEAELEHAIAADPDLRDIPRNWIEAAEAAMPTPKRLISLRLDADVLDWFKGQGSGYQTRINAVLRAFVQQSGQGRQG